MTQIAHNIEEHARSLADYMPNGRLFEAKHIKDSNFNQLLRGIAGELFTAEGYLITLEQEYIPDQTNIFLDEWERALGIPDDCFSGTGTNNERRLAILTKLASLGIQTADDFVALGAVFGVTVSVTAASTGSLFPMTFPITLFDSPSDARNTFIVTFTETAPAVFPLTFPIVFGSSEIGTLECLFSKLKPAHCDIIFKQVT